MNFFLQCSYILKPHNEAPADSYLLPLLVVSLVLALYVIAACAVKQTKKQWNNWRTISFSLGCILTAAAFSPNLLNEAHHDFRGHMLQHLLLGMLAPIGFVAGAPVTLVLRVLPKNATGMLCSVLNSTFVHFMSHPFTALVLNIGGMFLLYLTPIYNQLHTNTALQYVVHFHFLTAGYLFTWAIIGPDPAPRRPKLFTRTVALFLSIAAHSFLSKLMYAYSYPKNSVHSEQEIQEAAKLMYYGGDFSELILAVLLFTIWYNKRGRPYYALLPVRK